MKTVEYKRPMQPNFKNQNGDTYVYGRKYVELLLDMLHSNVKTKEIDRNRLTITRTVDDDTEYTVYVKLERL